MDLLDLPRKPALHTTRPIVLTIDPHELVAQLGSEVASALSSALERVTTLSATGKIDRSGLRALREELELARRVSIMGQQVSRLASGRVQLARERTNLTNLMREALRQRSREVDARGLELRQVFAPAEVMADATMLYSLLQCVLDWSFEHAVSRIDLTIDVRSWPASARVLCAFAHQPPDEVESARAVVDAENKPTVETMSWRLLHQTASVMGLRVVRKDPPGRTELTIEFPDTLAPRLETLGLPDFDDTASGALNSKPLAGRHVLVIAARREVRNVVREALKPMGLMVDFVTSVDEAVEFCNAALPHAIIHEARLSGDRFERLRRDSLAAVPNMAFIEIAEDGKGFETIHVGDRQFGRVARDAIVTALPGALNHEMTRLGGEAIT
jgi:CheY-like chemotaxis protein